MNNAETIEMDEKIEAMTLRLPKSLKDRVEAFAAGRGVTVTAFVRDALQAAVTSPSEAEAGGAYTQPGYGEAFARFIEDAKKSHKRIMILTENQRGERWFFDGQVYPEFTNESLLVLSGIAPATIVRRDIVAWFAGEDAVLHRLGVHLIQDGWRTNRRYF